MAREVTCVTTDDSSRYDDCRCIEKIGYELGPIDVSRTKTPAEVYDDLKEGKDYYVEYRGTKPDLIPDTHGSTKYVRTEPNDTTEDNLLKQPSC